MKSLQQCMLTLSLMLPVATTAYGESITSVPSPAVTNKALEIKVQTDLDFGNTVYLYTWCANVNGQEKSPFTWAGVETDKFKMSGNGGNYTFKISDIKSFYGLSDTELAGLTKLGFIAKTTAGTKTGDLFITVVQGRTDAYSGGEGTSDNPFILKTADDLKELSTTSMDWASDVYLRLDNDIDGSGLTAPIASKGSPFAAHFDGAGHCITNLNLTNDDMGEAAGLFGAIKDGNIKDLGVTGAKVSGTTYTGILVGYAWSGTIERCYTTGSVTASSLCAGGLVGENAGAVISDCYSGANVTDTDDCVVGGLVGKNCGVIMNCYATGAVSGSDYIGGVAGANYGNIRACVAINSLISSDNDYVARFGGNNNSRNIGESNTAWDKIPTGHSYWKTHGDHANMKKADQLAGYDSFLAITNWDFENVWTWKIDGNKGFPILRNAENQTNVLPEIFYDATTGITNVTDSGTLLFVGPNPVVTALRIKSNRTIDSCRVFSLSGSVLYTACPASCDAEIDMSGMSAGMYIVAIDTADGKTTINKIIKK